MSHYPMSTQELGWQAVAEIELLKDLIKVETDPACLLVWQDSLRITRSEALKLLRLLPIKFPRSVI